MRAMGCTPVRSLASWQPAALSTSTAVSTVAVGAQALQRRAVRPCLRGAAARATLMAAALPLASTPHASSLTLRFT